MVEPNCSAPVLDVYAASVLDARHVIIFRRTRLTLTWLFIDQVDLSDHNQNLAPAKVLEFRPQGTSY